MHSLLHEFSKQEKNIRNIHMHTILDVYFNFLLFIFDQKQIVYTYFFYLFIEYFSQGKIWITMSNKRIHRRIRIFENNICKRIK